MIRCIAGLFTLALFVGGVVYLVGTAREYADFSASLREGTQRNEEYDIRAALIRIEHDRRLAEYQQSKLLVLCDGEPGGVCRDADGVTGPK